METRIKEEHDILTAKIWELTDEVRELDSTRVSITRQLTQLREDIYLLGQEPEAYFKKYGNERTY
jgi:uncharacterized coiled-coil DUF342 family protein